MVLKVGMLDSMQLTNPGSSLTVNIFDVFRFSFPGDGNLARDFHAVNAGLLTGKVLELVGAVEDKGVGRTLDMVGGLFGSCGLGGRGRAIHDWSRVGQRLNIDGGLKGPGHLQCQGAEGVHLAFAFDGKQRGALPQFILLSPGY